MEQEKKRKNFLGYDQDTMSASKPRSKYFVYVALLLTMITGIIANPIASTDPDWYIVILGILIFLALGAVFAQFISYIIRIVVKGSSDRGNKFDYFATPFLIIAPLYLATE